METWRKSLTRNYVMAIGEFERALEHCPDELWEASLWPVRKEHAYVWPVRRAGSKEVGDEAMLQIHSAFWNVAFHTVFHLDFYLSGGVPPFKPPAPFRGDEQAAFRVPRRTYTRDELLTWLAACRGKARDVIENLTDERADALLPPKSNYRGLPFSDLLLVNLRHVQEHSGQMNLFLGQHEAVRRTEFEEKTGLTPRQGATLLADRVHGKPDDDVDAWVNASGGYERLLPLLAMVLCEQIRPAGDVIVGFDVGSGFAIKVAKGQAKLQTKMPKRIDATVHISDRDLLRLLALDLDVAGATADGRIKIDGDEDALDRLLSMRPQPSLRT